MNGINWKISLNYGLEKDLAVFNSSLFILFIDSSLTVKIENDNDYGKMSNFSSLAKTRQTRTGQRERSFFNPGSFKHYMLK